MNATSATVEWNATDNDSPDATFMLAVGYISDPGEFGPLDYADINIVAEESLPLGLGSQAIDFKLVPVSMARWWWSKTQKTKWHGHCR